MERKFTGIGLLVFVIIMILVLIYKSAGIKRTFQAEALRGIHRISSSSSEVLVKNDIKDLPDLIQKYLIYVGVIGKERVKSLRTVSVIDMNLGLDRGQALMKAEEYNFYDEQPSRMVLMQFKMKALPVVGLDSYIDGKGRMLMKPLGLFTVTDAKGHDMDDTSAAIMMFLNMCTAAPATLIDDRIQWTVVDSSTINATFNDNGCKVSAVMTFNDKGELIEFSTEDKYYLTNDNTYKKVRWSTPIKDYRDINGLKLSTYGEATWHFPEGDFIYGKSTLKEIEYNCKYLR